MSIKGVPLTHGESVKGTYTTEYKTWKSMKKRCTTNNPRVYSSYKGRGIKVCKRWRGTNGYSNFLKDMGRRPSDKHSIDRINNDGNYEPSNCRWATRREQMNNRRNSRKITYRGMTRSIDDWSRIVRVSKARLIYQMDKKGLSFEEAFVLPKYKRTK